MLKKRYILRTILIVLGVIVAITVTFVGEQYYRWHICNFRSKDEAQRIFQALKGTYPTAFIIKEGINYPR